MPNVIILDRIEPGEPRPPYCIHGRVTCIGCDEWCWLGDKTYEAVINGEAEPMCRQCATRNIAPGTKPKGHISDHRRADGPH